MSQNNNSTTLFFGLDMAKASLPLHLAGNVHPSPTTPKAIANWSNGVRVHPHAHAVCEATGGYEQIILAARRRQLLDHKIMTQNHAEHDTDAFSKKPSRQLRALLEKQIAQCDQAGADLRAQDEALQKKPVGWTPFPAAAWSWRPPCGPRCPNGDNGQPPACANSPS